MRVILLAVSIISTILAIPVEADVSQNGNTAIAGEQMVTIDGRCIVPLTEGEGIGGHVLGAPKAACNVTP